MLPLLVKIILVSLNIYGFSFPPSSKLLPICQVKVSVEILSELRPSSFLPPRSFLLPHLRDPDLNGGAGPQLRATDLSGHCRTSAASSLCTRLRLFPHIYATCNTVGWPKLACYNKYHLHI